MNIDKYLKIINSKKNQKQDISDFLEKELKITNIDIIVDGNNVYFKSDSNNRFLLSVNEKKIIDFIESKSLIYKK